MRQASVGERGAQMAEVRRVDHIAIVVADTETAKAYFSRQFGLAETHSEVLESPYVRLTYLDAGNVSIQLVEPLDAEGAPAAFLEPTVPGSTTCASASTTSWEAPPAPARVGSSKVTAAGGCRRSYPANRRLACRSSSPSSSATRTSTAEAAGWRVSSCRPAGRRGGARRSRPVAPRSPNRSRAPHRAGRSRPTRSTVRVRGCGQR